MKKGKWLVWDLDRDNPFVYETRKEAEKDLRIFNEERSEWQPKNLLFKQII
jgi:hypothetical protein